MADKGYLNLQESDLVTTQSNTTGEFSEIIEVETPIGRELRYDPSRPIEFFLMAHDSFTTGGAGSQETFVLSNKLADSPLLDGESGTDGEDTSPPSNGSADLVVYSDGGQVAADAVRYDTHSSNPNEIDYTDGGSVEELDVYYIIRDSFEIEGRVYVANEQAYDRTFTGTKGLHVQNVRNENEQYNFYNSFRVGPKEKLRFFIKTDVDLANWNSNTDDQSAPTSGAVSFSKMRLPVTEKEVSGRKSRGRNRGANVSPANSARRYR